MKKLIIFVVTAVLILGTLPETQASASYNSSVKLRSDIALLVSLDTGDELFSVNPDKQTPPASLTKIVTAVLAIKNCNDLSTVITVPKYCIDLLRGTDSSVAGLLPEEQVTMQQLLYCLLVKSANEAALIIADYIGNGSIDNFVAMMNSYVQQLGCANTHFKNPHGLDADGHYTCARDMIKIAKSAMELPVFAEIVGTTEFTMEPTNKYPKQRKLSTTNFMMLWGYKEYYVKEAVGIKTGSTDKAGKCFITTASKNGYSYMAICMGSPYTDYDSDGYDENFAFIDCKTMLDWAFENIRLRVVAQEEQIVSVVNVNYAWGIDHLRLVPQAESSALVPNGVEADSVLIEPKAGSIPESVNAPVKKGDVIGEADILYAGSSIGTIKLVAAEDVDRSVLLFITQNIGKAAKTTAFKVAAVLLVLLVIFLVVANIYVNDKKKRKKVTMYHPR